MTQPTPPTPPSEPIAMRLVRAVWNVTVRRDVGGIPRVPTEFVAEQGQFVRILDVRDPGELTGPLGHIPAVTHVPMNGLGEVPAILDRDACVVLVSSRGDRAGIAALYLEKLGMRRVAAMEGGMTGWKAMGFTTLRDEASVRRQLKAFPPGIGRDGRPLVQREKGTRLTVREVEDHVGDHTSVRWVKLAAFLMHGKRSCVDGRDDHGVIGTAGGDAGELLLALASVESVTGKALEDEAVARLFEKHVDTFGRFYMHSDVGAMNRLIVDNLRQDDRIQHAIKAVDSPEEWRTFLKNPPEALRPALLEHLVKPEVMGCGHLRLAMTDEGYGVRPALARAFLRAFHSVRWAGAPELDWVILGGEHLEGAVVSITVEGVLRSYSRVPLLSPTVAGAQVFVNHPQVTAFLRQELTAFLLQQGLVQDEAKLAETIETLGARQLGATLTKLAKSLPLFEVKFNLDGRPSVKELGTV